MTLPPRTMAAGSHQGIELDVSSLPSGIYFYRVVARTAERTMVETGQMMLVK